MSVRERVSVRERLKRGIKKKAFSAAYCANILHIKRSKHFSLLCRKVQTSIRNFFEVVTVSCQHNTERRAALFVILSTVMLLFAILSFVIASFLFLFQTVIFFITQHL